MSHGQNRRFPRTAQAMPEARPKIEREKIRHRRPNDLKFDDGDEPVSRQAHRAEEIDHDTYVDAPRYQEAEEDWTVEEDTGQEAAAWNEDPEGDWVLDGDDDGHHDEGVELEEGAHGEFEEEGGVVWEDDAFPADHAEPFDDGPDEMSFGSQSKEFGFAPEVELAGRRDVRPKAPRPAPAPSARAPAQAQRRPQGRQPRPDWNEAPEEPIAQRPRSRKPAFEPRQPPAGPAHADSKRFSRTRATLGAPATIAGMPDEEVLEQPRSSPRQRRRQAQPAPAPPKAAGRRGTGRHGRTRGRGLIAIVLLVLLAGAGWFTYQSTGPDGAQSLLDRLSALIPLPGSSRTAADTSFGSDDGNETGAISAEEALSNLEQRIQQQDAGQAAPAADPDGPPIPQFKPLPGATRSISVGTPVGAIDDTQFAASDEAGSDDEQTNGLSIFKQLWRYLSPG